MADLESKSSSFIEKLSQYSKSNVKCRDCKKKMENILELIYNLPPKDSRIEADICEHCKEMAHSCEQCEMLVKMVDKDKINEYKKVERWFSEWVNKIQNSLRELIECKGVCKHGTLEDTTPFLRFPKLETSKRYLNIETFPPRARTNLTSDEPTEKHDMGRDTTHSLPDKLTEEPDFGGKRGENHTSLETMIQEWQTKKRSFNRRGINDKQTKEQNYEKNSEARDNDTNVRYLSKRFLTSATIDVTNKSENIQDLKFGRKSMLDFTTKDDIKERYLNMRFVTNSSLDDMMTRRSTFIKKNKFGRIIIPRAFSDNLTINKDNNESDLAEPVDILSENVIVYKDIYDHILKNKLAIQDKMIEEKQTKQVKFYESVNSETLQDKMINNKNQEKYLKFSRSADDASLNVVTLNNDTQGWKLGRISLPKASLDNLITLKNIKRRDLRERSIDRLENLNEDKFTDMRDFGRTSVTNESFVNLAKDKYTEKYDFNRSDVLDTLLDNQTLWFKDTEELEFHEKGTIYDDLENLPQDKEIDKDIEENALKRRGLSWLADLKRNRHKVSDLNRTGKVDSSLQMMNRGIDMKKRDSRPISVLRALSDNPIRDKDIKEPHLETSASLAINVTEGNDMILNDNNSSYSLLKRLTENQILSGNVVTYGSVDTLTSFKQLEVQDFSKEKDFRDKSTTHAYSVERDIHDENANLAFPETVTKENGTKIHIEHNLNHAPQDIPSRESEEHEYGIKSAINFSDFIDHLSDSMIIDTENAEPDFGYSASTLVKPDNQINNKDTEDIKELDFSKTTTTDRFQENMDTDYNIEEDTEDKPIHIAKEVMGNISEKDRRKSSLKAKKSKTKHNVLDTDIEKDMSESKGAKKKTVLIITNSSKTLNIKLSESKKDAIKSSIDYEKLLTGSREETKTRKKSVPNVETDRKTKKNEEELIKEITNAKEDQSKSSFEKDKTSKRKRSSKFSTFQEYHLKKDEGGQMEISLKQSAEALKKTSKAKQNQKEQKLKNGAKLLKSEEKMYQRMQSVTQDRLTLRQVLLNKDKNAKIVIAPQHKPSRKSISLLPDSIRLESYRNKHKDIAVVSADSVSITESSQGMVECKDTQQVVSDAMIQGDDIVPHDSVFKYNIKEVAKPLLFRAHATLSDLTFQRPSSHTFGQDEENKSDVITMKYALSDKQFIKKGWTQLPSVKTMQRVIIYRMAPVHPELNWFVRNKENKTVFYDTGEILADIDKHGYGKLFYKSGLVALDYFRESGGKFKYMIYSDRIDQKAKVVSPPPLLAWFDHLGNALINDQSGNLRLQYNQFEGCVRDKKIGPPCKWKWHSLNDPPALESTATEQYEHIDPFVKDLGRRVSHWSRTSPLNRSSRSSSRSSSMRMIKTDEEEKTAKREYQAMINQEVINLLKRQKKRVYHSLLIKSKTVKLSNSWSLYVIDQEHVNLRFRNEGASLKFNLGMKLMSNSVLGLTKVEVSDTVVGVLSVPELMLP